MTKVCPRCEKEKPADDFFKNRRMKDGLSVYCKVCTQATRKDRKNESDRKTAREYKQRIRRESPESERERDQARYANNPVRRTQQKEANDRWYQENAEEYKAKLRADRKVNPDKYRSYDLKKKYGITLEDKQKMLKSQGGRCANPGCRTSEPGGRFNDWHVDHNHLTNQVRGILCASCNLTLGNAKEDRSRLIGLAEYLQQYEEKSTQVVEASV